jgi:capsular exopolysaccharide synthesis family protein
MIMKFRPKDLISRLTPPVYVVRGAGPDGLDSRLVAYTDKDSDIAEQYRMLETYLQAFTNSIGGNKLFKSIVITSSLAQEGKTITCCNLAMTLAAGGEKKVVLVDCDLRSPDIHTKFGMDRTPGLSDIVNGNFSVAKIAKSRACGNLYVLPAGSETPGVYEFLRNQAMKSLFEELKSSFDYVIIDTPPVIPVFDSRIVGEMCDAVILVARSGATSKNSVKEAFRLLHAVQLKPIGCILTDYSPPLYQHVRYFSRHAANP